MTKPSTPVPDELIPDSQVWREFGISSMTGWRWDHDPELNFPPPVKIRKRKFRSRAQIETFKKQKLAAALAGRNSGKAA